MGAIWFPTNHAMEIDSIKKIVAKGKDALQRGKRGEALVLFERACARAEKLGRDPSKNRNILSLKAGLELVHGCILATKNK